MSLPYPSPTPIKTTKRCRYSLPGRVYNCRAIGMYVLDGNGYCGPHYDAKWEFLNPVLGQQHDWHIRVNHITGEPWPYPTCRRCGDIKQHEGLAQGPCRGVMPEIRLWGAA